MSALLSADDLHELTHRRQPAAQLRALKRMGLQPMVRPDGTPAITWEIVNAKLAGAGAPAAEWQPDLRRIRKAG